MKVDQACEAINKARDITQSTAKAICGNLRMFQKDIGGDDITKLLNDYKIVEEYLNNKKGRGGKGLAVNSLKTYYTSCKTASTVLKCTTEAINFYDKKMIGFAGDSEKARDESLVPEKFGDELPKWSDLADLHSAFKDKKEFSVSHAIVSLYTMRPPRRLEYRSVYLLKDKPKDEPTIKPREIDGYIDDKGVPFNYIYKDGDKYKMILRDFKTVRRQGFGVYSTELSKDLSNVIDGYIEKQKIKVDTPLFPTKSGKNAKKPQSQSNFSKLLIAAFGEVYAKHDIGEQNIRDIYITSNVEGKKLSMGKKKQLAKDMGHTITQQQGYMKNKSSSDESQDKDGSQDSVQDIRVEPIDAEPIIQDDQEAESEGMPQPSVEVMEQVEKLDKVDKEDVLRTIKEYYQLKIEYMRKKLAMLDKVI